MPTNNAPYDYSTPAPFTVPNTFFQEDTSLGNLGGVLNQVVSLIPIPRETLHYSAIVIEEIMYNIDSEYVKRGRTKPSWKKYRAGTDDYTIFSPNPRTGTSIQQVAVKFFPQIVKDIMTAIEVLIADSNYPDDKGSYFARIFGNGTIMSAPNTYWNASTVIKDGYIIPATNAAGSETINPKTRIIGSTANWPFPAEIDKTEGHLNNPLLRMGVDIAGNQRIKNQQGSIESSAPDFPASVIGKRRTETNYPIAGQNTTGIDGVDIPMRPEGRPSSNRKNVSNTSQGVGAGKVDYDAGYSYLAHHPLTVEQLRYQPPIIEKFDGPDKIPPKVYVQNLTSPTTINIPYVTANPKETTWKMNWGRWLVKGDASSGSTGLHLDLNPDQFNNHIPTNCPFPLLFPPASSDCRCGTENTVYAIWGSRDATLVWEEISIRQDREAGTESKPIGPKTRLRVKYNYSRSGGSPDNNGFFAVLIRATALGDVNAQPFIPVLVDGNPDPALTTFTDAQDLDRQTHSDGSVSVNIIDAIKVSYPTYTRTNDVILAMAIYVNEKVSGQKTCFTIDTSSGTILSPSCVASLKCVLGSAQSDIEYVALYEPALENSDPRLS